MEVAPVKTQRDYRYALKEIEGLMRAERNTPDGDRLDVLVGSAIGFHSTCIGSHSAPKSKNYLHPGLHIVIFSAPQATFRRRGGRRRPLYGRAS
jgi:hypothetical protein